MRWNLPIKERYELHRLKRPEAAPWDKVIHYALNGNEFGKKLKYVDWQDILKVNKNTAPIWVPLIMEYIMDNAILNEATADAIVQSNKPKQKDEG